MSIDSDCLGCDNCWLSLLSKCCAEVLRPGAGGRAGSIRASIEEEGDRGCISTLCWGYLVRARCDKMGDGVEVEVEVEVMSSSNPHRR